jgi:hypothetical protein
MRYSHVAPVAAFQVRNGKQTAILAVAVEGAKGKKDAEKNKKDQFYTIYRPNTGLQVGWFNMNHF